MVPPVGHDDFPEDQWYVMHELAFINHIGTHIEVPYHVIEDGDDLAGVPLERLCGDAVILDLRSLMERGEDVTLSAIQEAAEKAGGIRNGDIIFCRFDADRYLNKPQRPKFPSFTAEAMEWLVAKGMKMMGVDTGGAEVPRSDPRHGSNYNHHLLLDNGIPLIENLANLSEVSSPRVVVFAFPVGIRKVDSFPLRVVAMEV